MNWKEQLEEKIKNAFHPTVLRLTDDSMVHANHYERPSETYPSHLKMLVVSTAFDGLSAVARQRKMHTVMHEEMVHIHSVSFRLLTPAEFEEKLALYERNNPKA